MYLVRMYCNQSPSQFKISIGIEFKIDFKLITKINVCNIDVKFYQFFFISFIIFSNLSWKLRLYGTRMRTNELNGSRTIKALTEKERYSSCTSRYFHDSSHCHRKIGINHCNTVHVEQEVIFLPGHLSSLPVNNVYL